MTLLDEARAHKRRRGPLCDVAAMRGTLDGALIREFDELIAADPDDVPGTHAEETLRDHHLTLSHKSINRHRRKMRGEADGCACDVPA